MFSTRRGDIYYVDLNPIKGSEQGGEIRPAVIIQNDVGNKFSPTLIVAAVTNKEKGILPIHVKLTNIEFLKDGSIILLEQIRTIDRVRLIKYIGSIDDKIMDEIDKALAISVGLDKRFCR